MYSSCSLQHTQRVTHTVTQFSINNSSEEELGELSMVLPVFSFTSVTLGYHRIQYLVINTAPN